MNNKIIKLSSPPMLDSIVDGEGLRMVLFVQGCPHQCNGCHNPETWCMQGGLTYKYKTIKQTMIDHKDSNTGITLSGGEPFQRRNIEFLTRTCKYAHKMGWDVWCYTGYKIEELIVTEEFYQLLKEIDVLVDGAFQEERKTMSKLWAGSENQRVINLKETLQKKQIVLYK